MKSKLHLILGLSMCPCFCQSSVYTNAWDVDLSRNPPAVIDVWRGETVALCARTGITNLPASAEFLWQSPSMGAAWYTTNAVATASGDVTAVWTPEMDGGDASYAFFFRVGNGDLYRPRGTIKMQGSPGATPNEIEFPARAIDFATVTVLNPPWATEADVLELLSDIGGGVIQEEDPVAGAWQTNHLATANPHELDAADVGAVPGVAYPDLGYSVLDLDLHRGAVRMQADRLKVYSDGVWMDYTQNGLLRMSPGESWYLGRNGVGWNNILGDAWSVDWQSIIQRPELEETVAAIEGDVLAAVFSLTNALLVVSNNVATIETNGVPIWTSAGGSGSVPPSVTNELWQSIAALQGTVSALQGTVAALSHAWGEYAPDGSPNPDPDYMLWINRPATVWGAGFQWAVSGGHAVLTATGTVAFAAGGSGEMRIGPGDGTNYFGFVTGGSVEVGASASGITVADEVATIVYPYDSGDFPTLWFTPDLATPFETMDGVVWVDNEDGTATASAPATTERGFWRATTSATYAAEFKSTMPARFSGGVWGATNAVPVVYDSTITIESGGKSYRIPAEEQ